MIETLHNLVVGTALVLMLVLLIGLVLAKGYQIAKRQLPRGYMGVFLAVCAVATVKAQKTFYVPSDFPTIQEAFDFWNGKNIYDAIELLVEPGTYPPVDLTYFGCGEQSVLTPNFAVVAQQCSGSVIIDGGGITNAVTMGSFNWVTWKGIAFSNAVCGIAATWSGEWDGVYCPNCIATCCQTGFKNVIVDRCLAYGNSCVGAIGSKIYGSTIVNNHGRSDADAVYEATGVQDCTMLEGSIVWGNTKDGEVANIGGQLPSHARYNCTEPAMDGGTGNICADPQFVAAANKDYHLLMGSPCINASNQSSFWEDQDFDGNPRVQRGIKDIGAYEFQPTNEAQTISAPVPVEFAWVDEKCPEILASAGGDYDKAVLQASANPIDILLPEDSRSYYSIWQSYLLDLNPTDSNATWYATIKMVDGEPIVSSEPQSPNRKYTNLGKHTLTDEVWSATCEEPHFFKVKVELK